MVSDELLSKVKSFINVDSDDFDIEIKVHIRTELAVLEVNNIIYDRIENERFRDLVDSYIALSTKLNFDGSSNTVNAVVTRERDRIWYLITNFIESGDK